MRTKNQAVGTDTDIVEIADQGYLFFLSMSAGSKTRDYAFRRDKDDECVAQVAWGRNRLLCDEVTFEKALTSGRTPMINGDTVRVHPDDRTLKAVKSAIELRNGATADEVCNLALILIRHISSNLPTPIYTD